MHPLDGIYAKIERTDESIGNLNTEINEFLTGQSDAYVIERGFYDDPTNYIFKCTLQREIPLRFAVLAGEIVHHLRSCLDHLVVILANPSGETRGTNHQFPICREREKFEKAVNGGQIQGVSSAALKLIEEAQPYCLEDPANSTLNVISQLDIRDKHRLLLVVAQTAVIKDGANVRMGASETEGANIVVNSLGLPIPTVLKLGEAVKIWGIGLAKPLPDFYADAEFAFQVSLANVGSGQVVPIIPTLAKMRRMVTELVASFEPLIS